MKSFTRLHGIAAALPTANIDTDKILAGRFLKTVTREGLGRVLFSSLREQPGFVLNQAPWNEARFLIALDNFGCGSSREHAPWALLDFGIQCIIAPSFADIFYTNCLKNGILPLKLSLLQVEHLMSLAEDPRTASMSVDLRDQILSYHGGETSFDIGAQEKNDLLNGVDEVARTLTFAASIRSHEMIRDAQRPWLAGRLRAPWETKWYNVTREDAGESR